MSEKERASYSHWPRITVVTPCYNQGQFLEETILSVLNQNYSNLEYFIIDGGSTDGSVDIIRKYEDCVDWWVSEVDDGQSDALCKGFDRASGDLLGWLNSDDVLFPGALKKIAEAYITFPNASLYVGGIAIGNAKGIIKRCSIPPLPWTWFPKYGIMGFGQPAAFFNADLYRTIGGINKNLRLRMDKDLWIRLIAENPRAIVVRKVLAFFRIHKQAMSTMVYDQSTKIYDQGRKEWKDFLEELASPQWRISLVRQLHRAFRCIDGSYLKSYIFTRRLQGVKMSQIWEQHIKISNKQSHKLK